LGADYLGRTDLIQVPRTEVDDTSYDVAKDIEEKSVLKRVQKNDKSQVNAFLSTLDGDAPPCDLCGHITVRNGTCYRCLNCGNSMGCS
jgi:ribonucleoside-diphosphate reductase alpha chain